MPIYTIYKMCANSLESQRNARTRRAVFVPCNLTFPFLIPEENETPADLSQRVVFKSKRIQKPDKPEEEQEGTSKKDKKSKKRPEPAKNKLSFQDDEDEDDE